MAIRINYERGTVIRGFIYLEDVGKTKNSPNRKRVVKVICPLCGNEYITQLDVIKYCKESKSCGCYLTSILNKRNTTHGKANTRSYSIWQSMNKRCHNENINTIITMGARNKGMR